MKMKRFTVIILCIMLLTLGLSSCKPASKSSSASSTIDETESATGTNSTETTAQAETTSTTVEIKTSIEEQLTLAPEISGLTKEVQDNKVVYITKKGNIYKIETGKYAGEYKDEVTVEGEKAGGVALVSEVVEKILEDELSKIPEGEAKLKIIQKYPAPYFWGSFRVFGDYGPLIS